MSRTGEERYDNLAELARFAYLPPQVSIPLNATSRSPVTFAIVGLGVSVVKNRCSRNSNAPSRGILWLHLTLSYYSCPMSSLNSLSSAYPLHHGIQQPFDALK
jgi:hypothetical protein